LKQIERPLASASADSAYGKEPVYEAIEGHSPERRTRVIIPPQRKAILSAHSKTAHFRKWHPRESAPKR
jgi:hypothetical protein